MMKPEQPKGLYPLLACTIGYGGIVIVLVLSSAMYFGALARESAVARELSLGLLPFMLFGGAFWLASIGLVRRQKWAYRLLLGLTIFGLFLLPISLLLQSQNISWGYVSLISVFLAPVAAVFSLVTLGFMSRRSLAEHFEGGGNGENER